MRVELRIGNERDSGEDPIYDEDSDEDSGIDRDCGRKHLEQPYLHLRPNAPQALSAGL
jgi:hypothetical protein